MPFFHAIHLTLPYPPSGGHRLGMKGRQHFRTAAYRRFLAEVLVICRREKVRGFSEGKLRLEATFFPATYRLGDMDNLIKTLQDALQEAGCYRSDSQIDWISAGRIWGTKRGEVEVSVALESPLTGSEAED